MSSYSRPIPRPPIWINYDTWGCRSSFHLSTTRNASSAEVCSYGRCGGTRPPLGDRPRSKKTVVPPTENLEVTIGFSEGEPPWDQFDSLDEAALFKQGMSDLRKYARHKCFIVGASKIRGGKDVLIPLILKARAAAA